MTSITRTIRLAPKTSRRPIALAIAFVAAVLALSVPALSAPPTAAAAECETCVDDGGGLLGGDGTSGGGGGGGAVIQPRLRILWRTGETVLTPALYVYYGSLCNATPGGLYVEFWVNPMDFFMDGWYVCWGQ